MQARQARVHRRAIVAGTAALQLSARLVVDDNAQTLRGADTLCDVTPVENDAIRGADPLTDRCGPPVHEDPSGPYPFLDLPARSHAVLGEHLVQSFFQELQWSIDDAAPATIVGVFSSDAGSASSSSTAPSSSDASPGAASDAPIAAAGNGARASMLSCASSS